MTTLNPVVNTSQLPISSYSELAVELGTSSHISDANFVLTFQFTKTDTGGDMCTAHVPEISQISDKAYELGFPTNNGILSLQATQCQGFTDFTFGAEVTGETVLPGWVSVQNASQTLTIDPTDSSVSDGEFEVVVTVQLTDFLTQSDSKTFNVTFKEVIEIPEQQEEVVPEIEVYLENYVEPYGSSAISGPIAAGLALNFVLGFISGGPINVWVTLSQVQMIHSLALINVDTPDNFIEFSKSLEPLQYTLSFGDFANIQDMMSDNQRRDLFISDIPLINVGIKENRFIVTF